MIIKKPSFRIKKAREICFSSDSKTLYSIGSRMNAFSVENRKETYSEKLIANEIYLALNPDNSRLCIKNTNGELVVWNTKERIHYDETGNNKFYNEGTHIHYSSCGNYLIDCNWDGEIQVYSSIDLEIQFIIKPPGSYMLTNVNYNHSNMTYILCYEGKFDEKKPTFIAVLKETDILSNRVDLDYKNHHVFQKSFKISQLAINSVDNKLAVITAPKEGKLAALHTLEVINLDNRKVEMETPLFPYMTYINGLVWSEWSNHILITTNYLPEDPELSFTERYEKYPPEITSNIHVFDCSLQKIVSSKVFSGARSIVFSPCKQFIAFGSDAKGVVIHKIHINEFLDFELV